MNSSFPRRKHCFAPRNELQYGWSQVGCEHIYNGANGVQGKVWVDLETDAYIIEVDGERLESAATTLGSAKQRCREAVNSKTAK